MVLHLKPLLVNRIRSEEEEPDVDWRRVSNWNLLVLYISFFLHLTTVTLRVMAVAALSLPKSV